jgi:hypothetical protein
MRRAKTWSSVEAWCGQARVSPCCFYVARGLRSVLPPQRHKEESRPATHYSPATDHLCPIQLPLALVAALFGSVDWLVLSAIAM